MPYYMEALILSGLKHFAPQLKTITIDNLHHPHASWSFPNASLAIWTENLKVMTSKFNEGGN
jgi:acetyl-CoA decarbonylase/synthase complex subunit epsilon